MQSKPSLQNSRVCLNLGLRILSLSYKTMQTEKLRNSYLPSNCIRTAWPQMLVEFSDLVEGEPVEPKIYYTPEEIRNANEICEIYSKLPYSRVEKRITLTRARTKKTWREIAEQHKLRWEECRSICDTVILHLVQVAALDKYRHVARQVRQIERSKAHI